MDQFQGDITIGFVKKDEQFDQRFSPDICLWPRCREIRVLDFNDRMVYVQSKWKSNRCRAELGGEEARDFVVGSVVRYWLDRIESSSSVLAELERTKREFDTNDDSRQETRRQVAVDWRGSSLSLNIPEW